MKRTCTRAEYGWNCTREPGHAGPCVAVRAGWFELLIWRFVLGWWPK